MITIPVWLFLLLDFLTMFGIGFAVSTLLGLWMRR